MTNSSGRRGRIGLDKSISSFLGVADTHAGTLTMDARMREIRRTIASIEEFKPKER